MKPFNPIITILLFIVLIVLVVLGSWQLHRLGWKENLIARVENRINQPPIILPALHQWTSLEREEYEFRHVFLSGYFDHDKEQYWFTHSLEEGTGVEIITPFIVETGSREKGVVLVNRGFIHMSLKDPQTRPTSQMEGHVELTGYLRWPGKRYYFDPPDEADNRLWFVRDLEAMAQNINMEVAPFFVNVTHHAIHSEEMIHRHHSHKKFPNRHLEYAITWYGLAFAFMIICIGYYFSRTK